MRIALGHCTCRAERLRPVVQGPCSALLARLAWLEKQAPHELLQLPEEHTDTVERDGKSFALTTWRGALEDGRTLIVVQALIPSLRWPTYYSLYFIGHVVADGIVVNTDGRVEVAPDDLLWYYR